jgi:hypothetical protein
MDFTTNIISSFVSSFFGFIFGVFIYKLFFEYPIKAKFKDLKARCDYLERHLEILQRLLNEVHVKTFEEK